MRYRVPASLIGFRRLTVRRMFLFIISLRDKSAGRVRRCTLALFPRSFTHSLAAERSEPTAAAPFSFIYGARECWLVTFDLLVTAGVEWPRAFRRNVRVNARNGNCRASNAPTRKICASRWKRAVITSAVTRDPSRPSRSVTFVKKCAKTCERDIAITRENDRRGSSATKTLTAR